MTPVKAKSLQDLQPLRQLSPLCRGGIGRLQGLLGVEPLEFGKRRPHFRGNC